MSLPVAFWDSSALVPLCVPQIQTIQATALYQSFGVVAWWATQVEIMSGLTRLERMGQISRDEFLVGKQLMGKIVQEWISADSPESAVADACRLLEAFPLRAADALQLSVALNACEHKPQGYLFITADQRLADAARQSGFSVEFI
jgi:predicted nucleic acid-binding protein